MLPLLVESGLIKEAIHYKERDFYEHILGHSHHDHIICIKCGRVIEFKEEKIEQLQDKVCKKYRFIPSEHHLEIKGYCKQCK